MRAHAALASAMLGQQQQASAEGQRAVELLSDLPDSITMPALAVRALSLAIGGQVAEARSMLARCEELPGRLGSAEQRPDPAGRRARLDVTGGARGGHALA